MTVTITPAQSPFTDLDPDRREIWEILMQRDFQAFVAADWSMIEGDFWQEGFCGIDARQSIDPDQWRINYPNLETYRDEWLRQAREFAITQFSNTTLLEFLFDSCRLQDVEIVGDRAAAHKKFFGKALTVQGDEIVLNFQTFYQLVRRLDRWMISGFVGFLPYSITEMNGAS